MIVNTKEPFFHPDSGQIDHAAEPAPFLTKRLINPYKFL